MSLSRRQECSKCHRFERHHASSDIGPIGFQDMLSVIVAEESQGVQYPLIVEYVYIYMYLK